MFFRHLVIISPFILFMGGCKQPPSQKKYIKKLVLCQTSKDPALKSPQTNSEQKTITIWIHGTRAFFSKFICKDFFHRRKGLHCATTFEQHYHVREIAELLQSTSPDNFCVEDFYFYGWSGKLSFKARYKAAKKLYILIMALLKGYEKKYGIKPKVRIITHSHGGNVALNLVEFNESNELIIDQLILLACPVQEKTCKFIEHETFKIIFSLYSRYDSVQILDPQRVYYWLKKDLPGFQPLRPSSFFSQRCFPTNNKLRQAQIKLNTRGIMHIEFLTNKFIGFLPVILAEMNQWSLQTHNDIQTLILKTK